MEDTSELSSEEVTLLTRKLRVTVDFSVEVASHDMLDAASGNDVLMVAVRQLNPVTKQVIRYPVHEMVDACATLLDRGIRISLFRLVKRASSDPVVSV